MGCLLNALGIILHLEFIPYLFARYHEMKKRKDREKRKALRRERKKQEREGIVPLGYWDEQNKLDNLETESIISVLDVEDEDIIVERDRILDQECEDDYKYDETDMD